MNIINPKDSIQAVEESMAIIEQVGGKYKVATEKLLLKEPPIEALNRYLFEKNLKFYFAVPDTTNETIYIPSLLVNNS